MGSYWAYYELGWGGFWFWDPVENASFIPWLTGTALLHSAIVMEKRSALKIWTVLLAILTFSMSLLGTFLVRSGVLTSVHAFATDPTRGVFILCILGLFIGGSFALFALRAGSLSAGGLFHPISREGALVLNNLFLTTAAATVLVGTLYPLVVEAITGDKISVGAPFFNLTFGPLMIPLLAVVPFGPLLAWKRGDLPGAAQRLMTAFAGALAAVLATLLVVDGASVFAALGVGLALWLMLGAITDIALKSGIGKVKASVALRRLLGLPRSAFGTALAHFGVGVSVLGIVGVVSFEQERILTMKPGETVGIAGYTLRFDGIKPAQGPNFTEQQGTFEMLDRRVHRRQPSCRRSGSIRPGRCRRRKPASRRSGSASSTSRLGDETDDGGAVVRIWWKPMVTLIWIGGLVMMFAGVVSLLDRRLRVGAPARPAKARAPEPGRRGPRMRRLSAAAALLIGLLVSAPAWAVLPGEVLADPALEARARLISAELRCMVCQNQSIDISDAELAHDLRVLVRDRLKAGDTDEQVLDYVVSRYGEFVLLKPRFSLRNAMLWGTPVVLLVGRGSRHGRRDAETPGQGRHRPVDGRGYGARRDPEGPGVSCLHITKISRCGNGAVM